MQEPTTQPTEKSAFQDGQKHLERDNLHGSTHGPLGSSKMHWRSNPWFQTRGVRNTLNPLWGCHGPLPSKNPNVVHHDHWSLAQQSFPLLYQTPGCPVLRKPIITNDPSRPILYGPNFQLPIKRTTFPNLNLTNHRN